MRKGGVSFLSGFTSLFRGPGFLLNRPGSWPYAAVPVLVFALLEGAMVAAGYYWLRPWVETLLPETWGTYGEMLRSGAGGAAVLLAAVLGWFVAMGLAPALSSPALERLVAAVEEARGVPPHAALGFVSELFCGFRAFAAALAFAAPILVVLWIVSLVAPVLAPLTTALKLSVAALSVAWGLFDYPLTLRGVGVRRRLQLLKRHPRPVFGFGAGVLLAFWLPCCGIVLLPVAVVAATDLLWRILEGDPEALPELGRPAGGPRQ
jgi:CysZ protein